MDLQLTDRHVLITGGSKGIGLACAQGFLREGARISLVARDPGGLNDSQAANCSPMHPMPKHASRSSSALICAMPHAPSRR